jgi:phage-related protein
MREILFYETETGNSPVIEFLEELPTIPSKYFKKVLNTQDLWEVRISSGNNIYRILGFFEGKKLIVLNHAFQKKTQKTPKQAIKIAEQRKREYLMRGNVK